MKIGDFCRKLYKYWRTNTKANKEEGFKRTIEKFLFELFGASVNNEGIGEPTGNENLDENYELDFLTQTAALKKVTSQSFISEDNLSDILGHKNEDSFKIFISDMIDELSPDGQNNLSKDFQNEIGICSKYQLPENITKLFFHILENMYDPVPQETLYKSMPNDKIFDQLSCVIKKLVKNPIEEQQYNLSYNSYKVKQKISSNTTLLNEISSNVALYYNYVSQLFKEVSDSRFIDNFYKLVRKTADELISQDLPQEYIFDKLVEWLQYETHTGYKSACRIIISFFVQNCEVFHEITK